MERTTGLQLSLQDWEQIFQDFRGHNTSKWLSQYPGLAILEQALYIVAKKDYPFRGQLLTFIEENVEILIGEEDTEEGLGSVVEALKTVLDTPSDGLVGSVLLKEQMMTSATVAMIVLDSLHKAVHHLQMLIEVLLGVINRPNHGLDRQSRGTACECLRELEKAYPCLLHACAGHILFLFQSERTHVAQNYTLLLTTVLHNLACHMYTTPGSRSAVSSSFLSTSTPLIPFQVPSFLLSSNPGEETIAIPSKELTQSVLKEFKRVVGLLLDRPQLLTTAGLLEFVSSLIDIAAALELPGSILKVQLSNFMYTYSPLLCHVVLMIYWRFMDTFEGEEDSIFKRLILLCNDPQQPLVFRMLAIHWLLGLEKLHFNKQQKSFLASMALNMYPLIYDPLSLKALKLDALAHSAGCILPIEGSPKGNAFNSLPILTEDAANKLFIDGSVCLSAFRWLPSWSSETLLMFRMLHRFLTADMLHAQLDVVNYSLLTNTTLFKNLEERIVSLALNFRRLVPCLLMLVDRLLRCGAHKRLGQYLLLILNRDLLSQTKPNKFLPAYFPIMERIAENGSISPGSIVELLSVYVKNQVKEVNNEIGNIWISGSQVLQICRTIMVHHYSSRAFHPLSNLLAFIVYYFPDIEVQDTARMYLRMMTSIPGKKLRSILKYGDAKIEDSQFSQVSSLLPPLVPSPKRRWPSQVASYIHIGRVKPLLFGQSWSIVLHDPFLNLEKDSNQTVQLDVAQNQEPEFVDNDKEEQQPEQGDQAGTSNEVSKNGTIFHEQVKLLRDYFSQIPDYVNGVGLKVKVQCHVKFRFDSEPPPDGENSPRSVTSGPSFSQTWQALYAVVFSFSTSGSYGRIPSVHIPFLMSEPPDMQISGYGKEPLDDPYSSELTIVPEQQNSGVNDTKSRLGELSSRSDPFLEFFDLELEPKDPVPTIIDVQVVTSDEDGQHIQGQLESIHVGIEDLFGRAPVPPDFSASELSSFYNNLFSALWEAFNRSGRLCKETFSLDGGKENFLVGGTESVKLLEARADKVISAVEQYMAPFVISVSGHQLVAILKENESLKDTLWKEELEEPMHLAIAYDVLDDDAGDQLYDFTRQSDPSVSSEASRENLGSLCILIFLPPRFHILLKMDISDWSTLVAIRTDYWPCLAYIDEYLEALITVK